ncbi:GTP-binding protein [Nonomuraea rubra]|uniref:GTP-binding protein n=1 Tax=Nonomuraea rubra TaxID=46180 RepID=UPI0036098794
MAHVDAGKTSLTERLLHAAGVIDEVGSVDEGNTQTDSLALERQRGITIKSAVVSFAIGGTTVNLIDTPGHPDFIAEVERVLSVLDGAVLVVSAVEGVQAQTRVLMRTLRRLGLPTLIFVNKIDRRGARYDGVLREITDRLSPGAVAMGEATGLGTPGAAFTPFDGQAAFATSLVDVLAAQEDALLAAYVHDEGSSPTPAARRARRPDRAGAGASGVLRLGHHGGRGGGADGWHRGVAARRPGRPGGAGVGDRLQGRARAGGEKVAYARMFGGTLRTRDRLSFGPGRAGKVTAISVFDGGTSVRRQEVTAGRIARLWGLADVRIGDTIGHPDRGLEPHFAPPTLETVVVPGRPADRGALHLALTQLAEQDPLIDLRQDDLRQEVSVSLYGEVQKEVIQATLATDFGLDVTFRETTTICVERPSGTGAAVEVISVAPNPFLATVGLRVEPGPIGSGVRFRLEVELGSLPYAFMRTIEETVHETLKQGLHGWEVLDCVVTLTHSGYYARQSHAHGSFDKSMSSTAGDFRNLVPLVLMTALRRAGTTVYEPLHRFRLELPPDTLGPVLPVLAGLGAIPRTRLESVVEGRSRPPGCTGWSGGCRG